MFGIVGGCGEAVTQPGWGETMEHPRHRRLEGSLNDPLSLLLPRTRKAFRKLLIASVVGIIALALALTKFTGYGWFQEWARGQGVKYILILVLAVFALAVGTSL